MVESLGLNTGHLSPKNLSVRRWLDGLKRRPMESALLDPDQLVSQGQLGSFILGSGKDIIEQSCDIILKEAEHEVIFVTCFWANSDSLSTLSKTLVQLSNKALSSPTGSKIRVRICLSSVSFFQKLFHTSSTSGHVYEPSSWSKKLNIPPPETIPGLDLQIKSVFILPFSVMHPKFIVIDRHLCLLPSCNVSWENWFEGCVIMQGPIVDRFVQFWQSFWGQGQAVFKLPHRSSFQTRQSLISDTFKARQCDADVNEITLPFVRELRSVPTEMIFLPSQHHRNPSFRPFMWQAAAEAPQTPLNTYIIRIIDEAQKSIFIQTPNLTSPPVIAALKQALERGVDVKVITNARLMWLEQLITAGTTTNRCIQTLIRVHKQMWKSTSASTRDDMESGIAKTGSLIIGYFKKRSNTNNTDPVHSHLKLTIVDDAIVVLGSGNMDRASWFTSQELGLGIGSGAVAQTIRNAVDLALEGRVDTIYHGCTI